jgi:sensor c-di-GMP phosphodiesterase-like protein
MQPANTAPSGDASVRYAAVRRRVLVLGALVIIGHMLSSVYGLWLSFRQTLEATDRELANLARALSEQTAWTWEAIDLLLHDTARWYLTDASGQSREFVDRVLAERAAVMRQVRNLIIVDVDGT